MQREKRIKSGPLLEVDFYPVTADGRRLPSRAPKQKLSTDQQQRYNRNQATKKLIRLVNANFGETDYLLHPTYEPERAPQTEEEARRDLVNYLRRVKTKRRAEERNLQEELGIAEELAALHPERAFLENSAQRLRERIRKLQEPMRYIYVIERQIYQRGRYKGRINWHFHIFITGGLPEKVMEKVWKKGIRVNCNRYQPDTFGPEAAATYMSKDPQGTKRFSCSLNLIKPAERVKDGKVSGRTVERMATQRVDDREYWEKRYPGYRFLRCYGRFNEYNGRWYVSVVMYKIDGSPPKWSGEAWEELF